MDYNRYHGNITSYECQLYSYFLPKYLNNISTFLLTSKGCLGLKQEKRLQRWVEHLSEVLNRDDPTSPLEKDEIVESEEIGEKDLGRWRLQEVKAA